jgi:DNA invertase Pin-like site-specific DNA recombinase
MRKGYASTAAGCDLDDQVARLKAHGCVEALVEREIGPAARQRLDQYLYDLRPGDELALVSLEVLGRSTGKLVLILHDLFAKDVGVRVLQPDVDLKGLGDGLLAILQRHEMERSRDRYGGGDRPGPNTRKRALTAPEIAEAAARFEAGESIVAIAQSMQAHRGAVVQALNGRRRLGETFYRAAGGEPRRIRTSLSTRPPFEIAALDGEGEPEG